MTDINAGMKKFFFLALLLSLLGCTSMEKKVDEHSSSWISRPLSELKQAMKSPDSYASKIDWDETTYPLANGYFIFVEPFSRECFIEWKINQRNIIMDLRNVVWVKGGMKPAKSGCGQRETGFP